MLRKQEIYGHASLSSVLRRGPDNHGAVQPWSIVGSRDHESRDPKGWYAASVARVHEAVELLAAEGVPPARVAIVGFSQGAGAAAMLSAELKPSFAIFVSGFVPRDEAAAASLLAGVDGVRSLHIIGAADTLVEPARSRALAELFDGAEIVEHEGGHHTPSNAAVRARMVDFLRTDQRPIAPSSTARTS